VCARARVCVWWSTVTGPNVVCVLMTKSSSFSPPPSSLSLLEEWASKVALLKRNCFASVFEKYFTLQSKGGEKSTAIIHYRDQETM